MASASSPDLQVRDGLPEGFPLQHVVPSLLKHELAAGDGHVGDEQALLQIKNTDPASNTHRWWFKSDTPSPAPTKSIKLY